MPMTFLAEASPNGPVPFPDPGVAAAGSAMAESEQMRIKRYREHWRFYSGKHWEFAREDGDPVVTLNYYKKIIDKAAAFLVSKGFNIKVPDPLVDTTAPFLREVWKQNKDQKFLWNLAITGGVSGDCFVYVGFREPTALEKRIFPYSKGRIEIKLLESERVFPIWDPYDKDRMIAVRIETFMVEEIQEPAPGSMPNTNVVPKRHTRIITPTKIYTQIEGSDVQVTDNPLGEINIVHIKNGPSPGDSYGMPDCFDIPDLNRLINEKATDVSDLINYNAFPTTAVFGANVGNLEAGPRQMWGLPEKARVEVIKRADNLGPAQEFINEIKEVIMDLSDTPAQSLGKIQAISNTSGVALHMQYMPLIEKMDKKRPFYADGIEEVNRLVLRVGQVLGLIDLPFDIDRKSGGKIGMVVQGDAPDITTGKTAWNLKPQSFYMNPDTNDFMDPMDMKVKYIRQYSFGKELREETYAQMVAEHGKRSKSFWDPEEEVDLAKDAEDKAKAQLQTQADAAQQATDTGEEDEEGTAATPPPAPPQQDQIKGFDPVQSLPQVPSDQINVPPEPVEVDMAVDLLDDQGGLLRRTKVRRFVVPTGVSRPEYLNPFETEVAFKDPLPKDQHLQMELYTQMLQDRIVSRRWVQQHLPDVAPHIDEIERDLQKETTSGLGFPQLGNEQPNQTQLQGTALEQEMRSADGPPSSATRYQEE